MPISRRSLFRSLLAAACTGIALALPLSPVRGRVSRVVHSRTLATWDKNSTVIIADWQVSRWPDSDEPALKIDRTGLRLGEGATVIREGTVTAFPNPDGKDKVCLCRMIRIDYPPLRPA